MKKLFGAILFLFSFNLDAKITKIPDDPGGLTPLYQLGATAESGDAKALEELFHLNVDGYVAESYGSVLKDVMQEVPNLFFHQLQKEEPRKRELLLHSILWDEDEKGINPVRFVRSYAKKYKKDPEIGSFLAWCRKFMEEEKRRDLEFRD